MSKYSGEILSKKILDKAEATGSTLLRISKEDYRMLVMESRINGMGIMNQTLKIVGDPNLKVGEVFPVSLDLK